MILVNQGIGTSVPEELEKGGHLMFHIKGGTLNGEGIEKFKGVDTMEHNMPLL